MDAWVVLLGRVFVSSSDPIALRLPSPSPSRARSWYRVTLGVTHRLLSEFFRYVPAIPSLRSRFVPSSPVPPFASSAPDTGEARTSFSRAVTASELAIEAFASGSKLVVSPGSATLSIAIKTRAAQPPIPIRCLRFFLQVISQPATTENRAETRKPLVLGRFSQRLMRRHTPF